MEDNEIDVVTQTSKKIEVRTNKKFSLQEVQNLDEIISFILRKPHKESKEFSSIVYNIDVDFVQTVNDQIIEISKSYCDRLIGDPKIDINLYYGDKTRKNFITFDDFLDHSKTNNRYIKRIQLSYNIMMLNNESTAPESYKLKFDFKSGYAHHKTDQDKMPPFFIIKDFFAPQFEIEFADYVVAQNFINHIEKCFEFTPVNKSKKNLFQLIQKNSHIIPPIIQGLFVMISSYVMFNSVHGYVANNEFLSKFFIASGMVLILGYNISRFIGRSIERNVDMIHDLSTLDFTNGDKSLNLEYANKNNKWWSLGKFLAVAIIQAAIGIGLSIITFTGRVKPVNVI